MTREDWVELAELFDKAAKSPPYEGQGMDEIVLCRIADTLFKMSDMCCEKAGIDPIDD